MLKTLKAYLFDVDGVLITRSQNTDTSFSVLAEIKKRLENGFPVGINTGRSSKFVADGILNHLEETLDNELLQKIFISCEKGAVNISYDNDGQRNISLDEKLGIPNGIKQEIKHMASSPKYSSMMFFDETKKLIVTVEELPDKEKNNIFFESFKEAQNSLYLDLKDLLSENNAQKEIKIDLTRIATDIEKKDSGKALGARNFLKFLEEKEIDPEEFFCFGDSFSDYDMQKELKANSKKSTFIFVGKENVFNDEDQKDIFFTKNHLALGTLEFLQNEID